MFLKQNSFQKQKQFLSAHRYCLFLLNTAMFSFKKVERASFNEALLISNEIYGHDFLTVTCNIHLWPLERKNLLETRKLKFNQFLLSQVPANILDGAKTHLSFRLQVVHLHLTFNLAPIFQLRISFKIFTFKSFKSLNFKKSLIFQN